MAERLVENTRNKKRLGRFRQELTHHFYSIHVSDDEGCSVFTTTMLLLVAVSLSVEDDDDEEDGCCSGVI